MNRRVLFVDDEPGVLQGVRHLLRKRFDVHTEADPVEALELIQRSEPFAVVVSDMRMPRLDGIEFLSRVRTCAPSTVRLMLTGNADLKTAIRAVNQGDIFKFLVKPCEATLLRKVIELAVNQHDLVAAEHELLERTLRGSIQALSELLAVSNPLAFGRVDRLRETARAIAQSLDGVDSWELDTAVSLSQTGCVGVAGSTLEKLASGMRLEGVERDEFMRHPDLGADLLSHIPRMEGVARNIRYQHKHYDGGGIPDDRVRGEQIPLSARILHGALAFDELKSAGWSDAAIVTDLRARSHEFDARVLEALCARIGNQADASMFRVSVPDLVDGMIIEEDVATDDGVLLVCRGQVVSFSIRRHLIKFHAQKRLLSKVLVSTADDPARESTEVA